MSVKYQMSSLILCVFGVCQVLSGVPRSYVRPVLCNDAALVGRLELLMPGEVSCLHGMEDGGANILSWDGRIGCAMCQVGHSCVAVANLPTSARYIRFRLSDGSWTPTHALNSIYTSADIFCTDIVWKASRYVKLRCTVYGVGVQRVDMEIAVGLSAAETVESVECGSCLGPAVVVIEDSVDDARLKLQFNVPGEDPKLYVMTDVDDFGVESAAWSAATVAADTAATTTSVTITKLVDWGMQSAVDYDHRARYYDTATGGMLFSQWDGHDNAGVCMRDPTRDSRGIGEDVRWRKSMAWFVDERDC